MDKLYHYTDFNGLKGILESQCLRATDAYTMNDGTEFKYARRFFLSLFESTVKDIWREKDKTNKITNEGKGLINFMGGFDNFVTHKAESLLKKIYDQIFLGIVGIPFITSFCSHDNIDDQQNGLLSQWRAYGKISGFAIEFNGEFEKLIKQHRMPLITLSDDMNSPAIVEYPKDYDEFKGMFNRKVNHVEVVEKLFKHFYQGAVDGNKNALINSILDESLESFFEISSCCKHYGFHEERESRIVVFINKDLKYLAGQELARYPKIKICENSDGIIRSYIELFKDSELPLSKAINRILVGPSKNKENNKEKLEVMLKEMGDDYTHIKVDVSEIPYV